MNYQETVTYLYNALPMFQRVGASAYKADLANTVALCAHLGNPQHSFKSIHVAGTNGKGSTSHSLASILQAAGYKTGLYTSPHLHSFTERVRLNGQEIPQEAVVKFVEANRSFLDDLQPSFFEMTVGLAFWYFAEEQVDIAVIEVGMGGRLDSTNVLHPDLCLITNIGYDHTQFLGNTLPAITGEKAGIIKDGVPVVISQTQSETQKVFVQKAKEEKASLVFADQVWTVNKLNQGQSLSLGQPSTYLVNRIEEAPFTLEFGLGGDYQRHNLSGILEAIYQLRNKGWTVGKGALLRGLKEVTQLTGLKGRWQVLQEQPLLVADTAHNESGMEEVVRQLKSLSYRQLWMVLGMVQDKDISKVLDLLPKEANYVFCQAQIPRALEADKLATLAADKGLVGTVVPRVADALQFAKNNASADDLIFVGGSTFVVAEIDIL